MSMDDSRRRTRCVVPSENKRGGGRRRMRCGVPWNRAVRKKMSSGNRRMTHSGVPSRTVKDALWKRTLGGVTKRRRRTHSGVPSKRAWLCSSSNSNNNRKFNNNNNNNNYLLERGAGGGEVV